MALKLTLAAKYAEHKRRTSHIPRNQTDLPFLGKSSTPIPRSSGRYSPSNRARHVLTFKSSDSVVSQNYSQLPGAFKTPSRILTPLRYNSSSSSRYQHLKPQTRSYRVEKKPNEASQKYLTQKDSVLSGLWNFAKRFSTSTEPQPSELSQLRESTRTASNTAYAGVDIDRILRMKKRDVVPIHNDPLDDRISDINEQRLRSERIERERLIDTLYEERNKAEKMRMEFEKLSIEMRQEFRKELRQATQEILNLTKTAESKLAESLESKTRDKEDERLFKLNEKFLTEKCEAEAKLESARKQLMKREAEIARLKSELNQEQLKAKEPAFQLDSLSLLSLKSIRSEYNHECSEVSTELDSIQSSRKINETYGKKLMLSLGDLDGQLKAIDPLRILSMTGNFGSIGILTDKEAAFLSESEEKIQKCHEYVTDFDIEFLQDPKHVSDLYNCESLSAIENCFKKAKQTVQTKITRTKYKEKGNFEALSSSFLSTSSLPQLEDKLTAYIANVRLHSYRRELVSLLKSIVDLLRVIQILKVKIQNIE